VLRMLDGRHQQTFHALLLYLFSVCKPSKPNWKKKCSGTASEAAYVKASKQIWFHEAFRVIAQQSELQPAVTVTDDIATAVASSSSSSSSILYCRPADIIRA